MKETREDLIRDIIHEDELSAETMTLMLANLEDAMETLDLREQCLLKKRYFEHMTLKATGLKVVNLLYEQYKKNPCDGITQERARQAIVKAIRKLRHPSRMKILRGEWTSKEFFALFGDKRG